MKTIFYHIVGKMWGKEKANHLINKQLAIPLVTSAVL